MQIDSRREGVMKNQYINDENSMGILMQDTLESFFEYEDCINPSETYKQDIKYKLETLISILKKTNHQYLHDFECLKNRLDT